MRAERGRGARGIAGALAEFYRRHWEQWVDAPLPALKGATPRAAAASPARRERLEALLAQFAHTATTLPDGRPDGGRHGPAYDPRLGS